MSLLRQGTDPAFPWKETEVLLRQMQAQVVGRPPEAIKQKETAFYEATCAYCGKTFRSYGNKNRVTVPMIVM